MGVPHDASPSSPLPPLDLPSPPSLLRERPSRRGPASPSSLLQAKGCSYQGAPARDPQNQILTQSSPRSPTQGPVGLSSWASLASPGLTRGRSVRRVACCPHPTPGGPPRAPRGVLTLSSTSGTPGGRAWHQLLLSGTEDSHRGLPRLPGQPLTLGLLRPPGHRHTHTHTQGHSQLCSLGQVILPGALCPRSVESGP